MQANRNSQMAPQPGNQHKNTFIPRPHQPQNKPFQLPKTPGQLFKKVTNYTANQLSKDAFKSIQYTYNNTKTTRMDQQWTHKQVGNNKAIMKETYSSSTREVSLPHGLSVKMTINEREKISHMENGFEKRSHTLRTPLKLEFKKQLEIEGGNNLNQSLSLNLSSPSFSQFKFHTNSPIKPTFPLFHPPSFSLSAQNGEANFSYPPQNNEMFEAFGKRVETNESHFNHLDM